MKKVSVILTTYNGASCVKRVVSSILDQEGVNELFELELIVVDDWSEDNTEDVLKAFNLNIHKTPSHSGGPNKGRNMGLKLATGDYLCIVDQDDEWARNRIVTMLPYCHDYPIVTSGYTLIDSDKKEQKLYLSRNAKGYIIYPNNRSFITKLTKDSMGQQTYLGAIIFDKALKDIMFEETYGMVDFDWVLKLFYNRESIEVCLPLYVRHVSRKNLSFDQTYRLNDFNHSLASIQAYANEFPKEVKQSRLRINGSRARYFYLLGDMTKARHYFLRSELNWKTVLYFITSFAGHTWVNRYVRVFG